MDTLTREEIERRISDSYELPNKVLELIPEPLVSVRTSTYNHGPYIKECIEGVLMQKTTFPVEYIIGEDYSTDETRSIVFEYAKKYPEKIRVITADYNVGAKANGRRCARACRGKYTAPCEGDDYWIDPYKLQKQVDFLEKNPEYGMCYTKVKTYIQQQRKYLKRAFGGNAVTFGELINNNTIPTPTVCLRKDLLLRYYKEVKPESKNWLMGDYPMWLWFARNSKIYFFNEITGVYRILDESVSHSRDFIKMERFYDSSIEIRKYFLTKYNLSYRIENIENRKIDSLVHLAVSYNKFDQFKLYISKTSRKNIKILIKKKIIAKSYPLFVLYNLYLRALSRLSSCPR
jgi:glycosyltransferase involved in cell wall biosynthesis